MDPSRSRRLIHVINNCEGSDIIQKVKKSTLVLDLLLINLLINNKTVALIRDTGSA